MEQKLSVLDIMICWWISIDPIMKFSDFWQITNSLLLLDRLLIYFPWEMGRWILDLSIWVLSSRWFRGRNFSGSQWKNMYGTVRFKVKSKNISKLSSSLWDHSSNLTKLRIMGGGERKYMKRCNFGMCPVIWFGKKNVREKGRESGLGKIARWPFWSCLSTFASEIDIINLWPRHRQFQSSWMT